MLIAVSVMAVVMAVLYAAYTSNIEAIEEGRHGSATDQVARVVFDQMCRDVQSAYLGRQLSGSKVRTGMIGENMERGGKHADRIDFTSLSHMALSDDDPPTDLCEVGYYLEEDEEERQNGAMILYRRDSPFVDEDLTKGGEAFGMATGVAGLDLVYLDGQGREFESWTTLEGVNQDKLPSAIRITLGLIDHKGQERTFRTSIRPELAGVK